MNFEDLQKSWQSQDAAKTISINADLLLNEVRRNQKQFRTMIFVRDVREVGIFMLLVPLFLYWGWRDHWTNYLIAFDCLVISAFFVLDRRQQKKKTPDQHGSLKACAATSLAEVNHQIWLLKNVLWWYLLPGFVPMLLCFVLSPLRLRSDLAGILFVLFLVGFLVVINAWLYWINQSAVRKHLQPRREELEKLLQGLAPEEPLPTLKTKKPLGPLLIVLAATIASIAVALAVSLMKSKSQSKPGTNAGIEAVRAAHDLPALAVVVTKDGRICDRAVAGVRNWHDATPATTNDTFHIGSCTKSMTATLAAIFIEQGKLRWDTTIVEVFPEWKGKMDKQYETVTVEQLLHHRGGVPGKSPSAAWRRAWQEIDTPTEQRREFIEAVLSAPPEVTPGTEKVYSNQGYTIVGAMLEKISGQDFESLMTEKLFKPLHMDTAGFGPPGTKGQTDQPWGHVRKAFMTLPVQGDNPPAISPAGRVHCSLDDLARYAMFHLQRGTNGLLQPETMARLHASPVGAEFKRPLDNYACGWARLERGWGGGTVLYHNGSNTMWYIVMWLAPEKDFCVIVATNIFNDDAENACDEMAVQMIKKWLPDSKL